MGSGGRNASLAAMRLGQGGQQKRQHSSRMDRPFIFWLENKHRRHCFRFFGPQCPRLNTIRAVEIYDYTTYSQYTDFTLSLELFCQPEKDGYYLVIFLLLLNSLITEKM